MLSAAPAFSQGVITTLAGADWVFPAVGTAADAPLGRVAAVVTDAGNNLYIADSDNQMIFRVTPAGALSVFAGNGLRGFSGDGGPAINASLNGPGSMAFDASGNSYFSDSGNQRIRRVSPAGVISTIAGTGTAGFSGDGGQASAAALSNPTVLAFNAAGELFFADTGNNRIRKIAVNGTITTVAGSGQKTPLGDFGPATSAGLNAPAGVALDSVGNVYIADTGNNRIRVVFANSLQFGQVIIPAGTIVSTAGTGSPALVDGLGSVAAFNAPTQLQVDAVGTVLVADTGNHAIRRIAQDGVTTLYGTGRAGFAGDGAAASGATFSGPAGFAIDGAGTFYIADTGNSRVRRIVPGNPAITTFAGNGRYRLTTSGTAARDAFFVDLTGIAIDISRNIYFADARAHRVGRVSPDGVLTYIAGTGQPGFSGDAGPPANAALNTPAAVAVDAAGNLYISDSGNHRVRRLSGGVITSVAGTGTAGFAGDGGLAVSATLKFPRGIAFDRGSILIADSANDRVRRIDPNGLITTVVGNGTRGSAGDGGPATLANLAEPVGVAVDPNFNVYIAEASGNRVRRVINATVDTFADGLSSPQDVLADASGNVFIADAGNHMVRRVSSNRVSVTFAGTRQPAFAGDGGLSTAAALNLPSALAIDNSGNVYIADRGNGRIRAVLNARPSYQVSVTSLNLSAAAGGNAATTRVAIAPGIAGMPYTVVSGAPWLTVDPPAGVSPASLLVMADPASLAPGVYQAAITITSAVASQTDRVVNVAFTVGPRAAAALAADMNSLSFLFTEGGAASVTTVRLRNAGAGTLQATAGADWLTVAAGGDTLSVTANPAGLMAGTYTAKIALRNAAGDTLELPVTAVVSPFRQTLQLSQSGLSFQAVASEIAPPVPPAQRFTISNPLGAAVSWTVSTLTFSGGQGWLSANAVPPEVIVRANPAGLGPGVYYGQVQVSALGADNSPQTVTVLLNVADVGANPGPALEPAGLILFATAGTAGSSQTVRMSNLSLKPVIFTSSRFTYEGGAWLAVSPSGSTIASGQNSVLTVQPDATALAAGSYRGAIQLALDDGVIRTLPVTLVVRPAGACTATRLFPMLTMLGPGVNAVTAGPNALEARVVDNCGAPVNTGTLLAVFTNADGQTPLQPVGDGRWQGTWSARAATLVNDMRVTLRATDRTLAGSADRVLTAAPFAPTLPAVAGGGVRSAASLDLSPIAPGAFISIFGTALADDQAIADSVPLPMQLAGTTVLLDDKPLPLQFVSANQINALVPYGIPANTRQHLVIRRGATQSIPESLVMAAAQPGIFTVDGSGQGQGHIYAIRAGAQVLAGPANPVSAGDVLTIYATGLGEVSPRVPAGTAAPPDRTSETTSRVIATIGGVPAQVLFAGLSPGSVGLYQINVLVPDGIASGEQPVLLFEENQTSPLVTITLR